MANDLRITDAVANAMLEALATAAGETGKLRIYAGALTAGAPGTPAGTLLAELTMNAAAFGAAAAVSGQSYNQLDEGAITADSSANASGDAGCFVLWDSAGTTAIMAGTVGTASTDMIIDNVTIAATATVSCTDFKIKLPKGWATA